MSIKAAIATTRTANNEAISISSNGLVRKRPFTVNEDLLILQYVNVNGLKNWQGIAKKLDRTAKQVRERWNGHLNPSINKGRWTKEEDRVLASKQSEIGNKWAEIAKYLPGRTDTMVKNRWNTSVRDRVNELLGRVSSPSVNYASNSYIGFANTPNQFFYNYSNSSFPSSPISSPSSYNTITITTNTSNTNASTTVSDTSSGDKDLELWLGQMNKKEMRFAPSFLDVGLPSFFDLQSLPPLVMLKK